MCQESAEKKMPSNGEILGWLSSDDPYLQYKALTFFYCFSQWDTAEVMPVLISKMGSECVYVIRETVLGIISHWNDEAIPVLLAHLLSHDWRIRCNCILALSGLGSDRKDILEAIFRFHRDPEPEVRIRVAWALRNMEMEEARDCLEKMLAEEKDILVKKELEDIIVSND